MTYLVEPSGALWKGRPVKKADPSTFEILGDPNSSILARDKGQVYVLGKPAKVNVASFRCVGSHHAVDDGAAYIVMATKLKAIPKADPKTFVALGENYSKDGEYVFFGAKRVRLKTKAGGSLADFRSLDKNFATDGAWMYFGTAHLEPPGSAPFRWSTARYLPFVDNQVNMSSGILTDGMRHFLHDEWVGLPDVDPDRIQRLGDDLTCGWRDHYVSDGTRVFFHGVELSLPESIPASQLDPRSPQTLPPMQVGPDVVRFAGSIWCGTQRTDIPLAELVPVGNDLYRSGDRLLEICEHGGVTELARHNAADTPDLEAAVSAALRAVLPVAVSIFDRYLPLESAPGDMDLDVPAPGGTPAFEVLTVKDGIAEVRVQSGAKVAAPADGLVTLCHRIWGVSRDRRGTFPAYANHATSYPDVDRLQTTLVPLDPGAWLNLASSLHAAGEEPRGALLAHLVMNRVWRSEPLPVELLKGLPLALAGAGLYRERKWDFDKTTNLGVVKYIAKLGLLVADDVRVQLEMINTLAGAVGASDKSDQTLKHAVPALLDALDLVSLGLLKEAIWTALDICTVAATVHAELGRGYPYTMLESASSRLVKDGINPDIQTVRLVEALWGLGREKEARALEAELLADAPRDLPCPGPYKYRVRFASFRGALLGARMRSLPARTLAADARAEVRNELQGELEALKSGAKTEGGWSVSDEELVVLEGLLREL